MRDYTTLLASELADEVRTESKRLGFFPNEDSSLREPQVVEIEKVLNDLIRAVRGNVEPSAFSLNA